MSVVRLTAVLILAAVAVNADVLIGTPDGTENLFCSY